VSCDDKVHLSPVLVTGDLAIDRRGHLVAAQGAAPCASYLSKAVSEWYSGNINSFPTTIMSFCLCISSIFLNDNHIIMSQ